MGAALNPGEAGSLAVQSRDGNGGDCEGAGDHEGDGEVAFVSCGEEVGGEEVG